MKPYGAVSREVTIILASTSPVLQLIRHVSVGFLDVPPCCRRRSLSTVNHQPVVCWFVAFAVRRGTAHEWNASLPDAKESVSFASLSAAELKT
jgi:hypothetical protein